MHHVVANLELLNLFQRQGYLAAAGLVALQVVLVETVEYLVVGEQAEAQVVVYEALVQRLVDGGEADVLVFFGEDVAQTLVLLLTVGQHVELVAFQSVVLQRLLQQVEVLVEERLRRSLKAEGSLLSTFLSLLSSQLYSPERLGIGGELCTGDNLTVALHLLFYLAGLHFGGILQTLRQGLRRKALLVGALDGFAHKCEVLAYQDGVFGQELQHGVLLHLGRQLGHDVGLLAALLRQLVLHLKGTYGVYLVAEEVDAEGVLATVAEHVEDAAAQGELAGLVDIVHLVEPQLAQLFQHVVGLHRLPLLQGQRPAVQLLAGDHHLGHGLGMGHDVVG